MRKLLRRSVVVPVLVVGLIVAGFGAYWFQPWKLWVDDTIQEEIPVGAPAPADPSEAPGSSKEPDPSGVPGEPSGSAAPSGPAGQRTVASGELISHEHTTTGTVRVLRLADGSLTLRFEDLDTSNGPDLRVWLTDAPVREGRAGWHVFDDGKYVSLGKLKGNKGSQNYALPAGTDLDAYGSVSIWCDRFDVSFGAAALKAAEA
ncbi:DM13 domain-containing protein [Streptomyces sp. GC420]|uniref:DM13 domain-containing protein n=1 Tax=Streptomyces sp. GC420 TaxID=2697568 RepID=UPI001AA0C882|nr:DM13 domain-containing protein [Streptomyces sp. GC420]NBM20767.1 electron transporter [Streptomyces sp. GC420]